MSSLSSTVVIPKMYTNNNEISESPSNADSAQVKKKKEKRGRKKLKHKKNKKKRKHRSSSSDSEGLHDSKKSKKKKIRHNIGPSITDSENVKMPGPSVPAELLVEQAKSRAPMTKEEWERSQNVIRRVYDESTGRSRLVRGDGEILEEIVSRDRHRQINNQATAGDGVYFQSQLQAKRK